MAVAVAVAVAVLGRGAPVSLTAGQTPKAMIVAQAIGAASVIPEMLADFRQLVATYDPAGKFGNDFLDHHLGLRSRVAR